MFSCLIIGSCKAIFDTGGGDYPVDGYYWDADTADSFGTRYSEKYLINLNILKDDKVIFHKKIRSDTAYIFSDSLSIDSTKNYSVIYSCNWQGARPDFALKMSVANLGYVVAFYSNDMGHVTYKEKLKITSAKIPVRFGVCQFSQELN